MIFGGGAFGKWLAHEGGALVNGISALVKEAAESSLPPKAQCGGHHEKTTLNQEAGSHQALSVLVP